jgi:hypothetical protein
MIKSGLSDTDVNSRVIYRGGGLSLKLSMKGETVNELSIVLDQRKKHRASDEGKTRYTCDINGDQEAYQVGKVYSTKGGE